jgi:hypothetical protein
MAEQNEALANEMYNYANTNVIFLTLSTKGINVKINDKEYDILIEEYLNVLNDLPTVYDIRRQWMNRPHISSMRQIMSLEDHIHEIMEAIK